VKFRLKIVIRANKLKVLISLTQKGRGMDSTVGIGTT